MRARVGQRGHEPERLVADALPERHLHARVPPVELHDLARQTARVLEGARRREFGADVREMLLEDRHAGPVSRAAQALADHGGRGRRVGREERPDLAAIWIEC
jgi:hypothetical protein